MKDERGVGIIEVLLGLVVGSVMISALAMPIYKVVNSTDRNNSLISVLLQIDSAIRYLAGDGKMADYSDLSDGAAPVNHARLDWTDYYAGGDIGHVSSYQLVGTQLQRTYDAATNTIAKNISSAQFSRSGRVITVVLTAEVTSPITQQQTLTYRIYMRPQ